MRNELVIDLFGHLSRQLQFQVEHVPRDVEAQLEKLALPLDVKRLLQWRWPRASVTIGPYTLLPAEDILSSDDLERLIASHMVPVGYARNGDILVIRFGNNQEEVGLVSHDDLWERQGSAEEAYVVVCPSVEEYLYRASEGHYLPRDSFAAEEWQQMLQEIARRGHGA